MNATTTTPSAIDDGSPEARDTGPTIEDPVLPCQDDEGDLEVACDIEEDDAELELDTSTDDEHDELEFESDVQDVPRTGTGPQTDAATESTSPSPSPVTSSSEDEHDELEFEAGVEDEHDELEFEGTVDESAPADVAQPSPPSGA